MQERFDTGCHNLDQPLTGLLAPDQLLLVAQLGPEEALTLCLSCDQPVAEQEQLFAQLNKQRGRRPVLQLFMLVNGQQWTQGPFAFPEKIFTGVKKRLHFRNKLRYLNLPIDAPLPVALSLSQFRFSCLLEDEPFGVKDFRLN